MRSFLHRAGLAVSNRIWRRTPHFKFMAESVATPPTAEPTTESPAKPAAVRRYTGNSVWRARPLFNWLRRRSVYRGVATLVLIGLAGLFGWLVFRPLFHPNAQLQFLSGADYHVLRAPPAAFALEDADALRPLAKVLYSPGGDSGLQLLGAMKDPNALRSLAATWADLAPDRSGVLMVYVDGHGVSDDGAAYLLCRNFDPANPAAGRLPLRDLLHQLSEAPVGVKLLILDAGRIPCDPRLGMLVNEFPRLLEQEVARTQDSNLWVLSSNAAFQRSHVSWSLERSVFGYFVTAGLSGAADLNKRPRDRSRRIAPLCDGQYRRLGSRRHGGRRSADAGFAVGRRERFQAPRLSGAPAECRVGCLGQIAIPGPHGRVQIAARHCGVTVCSAGPKRVCAGAQ